MVVKGKKKKKSKGAKGRTDAWTLDGGGEYEGKKEYVDETGKRIQRRTQEQDESRRRGNLKGIYANQIKTKEKKLKEKVKFEQFIPADPEEGEYSFDYVEDDEEKVGETGKKVRQRSSLSVIHRVQQMSGDNETRGSTRNSTNKLVSNFLESIGSDDDEGTDEDELREVELGDGSSLEEELEEDVKEGNEGVKEKEEAEHEGNLRHYSYLFPAVAQAAAQPQKSKPTPLGQIGSNYVVHGSLNESVQSLVEARGGTGLTSVYGTSLPKLWRHRGCSFPHLEPNATVQQKESKKEWGYLFWFRGP